MPAGAQRLLDWFDAGLLVRPNHLQPNVVSLARALLSLCGAPGIALDATAEGLAGAIGRHDHYVFVLCDGVGMNLVERMPRGAFLRRQFARELQATFPSSTAPALTTLATGRWPAQHAVPFWWTRLPDRRLTATILKFTERLGERPLEEFGITPEIAFPCPSVWTELARDAVAFSPSAIADSTTSRYFYGGQLSHGYRHLRDAADAIVTRVAAATAPTYSYLYVPYVDAAEHEHGVHTPQVREALAYVDGTLERLAAALAGRARIIVTADHGLAEIAAGAKRCITDADAIISHLACPPSGEPRVPSLHVLDGHHEDFEQAFASAYGDDWTLVPTADAVAFELFGPGPMSEVARARVGDYIAVSAQAVELAYGTEPEGRHGGHGALTPDEMRVPLVLA